MPPSIATIDDLGLLSWQNSGTLSGPKASFRIASIPTLPQPTQAQAMLERVVNEFLPIIQRRQYNVQSVSEMCCCNDGLDFVTGNRKRRIMSRNVWGYNQTTTTRGSKRSHTIHLRLRRTHSQFHTYEDVAGTLAHELAHCVHGPHDAKFYKLMDEILEEHASLMASGMRGRANGGFTNTTTAGSFAGEGHRLGGSLTIEQARAGGQGYALGGDSSFMQWMTPTEAAVAAAEARRRQQHMRLRGETCCQPCIITLDEEGNVVHEASLTSPGSSDDDDDRKPAAKRKGVRSQHEPSDRKKPRSECIDLTESPAIGRTMWACGMCTFQNDPTTLACSMCYSERPWSS